MVFTPQERRLLSLLVLFLAAGYLVTGLREAGLLRGEARVPAKVGQALAVAGDSGAGAPSDPAESTGLAGSGTREQRGGYPVDFGDGEGASEPRDPLASGYLDLNCADSLDLLALPGIGPALCGRILAERRARGRFSDLGELRAVRGIGPKRLEALAAYLKVLPPAGAEGEPVPLATCNRE